MPNYLELDIVLRHIKPKIWRRIMLPITAKFIDLHDAIQDAGPWTDCHLWEFSTADRDHELICMPNGERDLFTNKPMPSASKTALADHLLSKGAKVLYTYDMGDGWEHEIKLRKIVELPEKFKRRLLAGERAFPPEDCGGPWGYFDCLVAVGAIEKPAGPDAQSDEEIKSRREWLGDWTPEWNLEEAKNNFDH